MIATGIARVGRSAWKGAVSEFESFRPARRSLPSKDLGGCGVGLELHPSLRLDHPQGIYLGDHVFINEGCVLQGFGGLYIASHVILGPWVLVMTSMHRHRGARLLPYDEIEIQREVRIGTAVWIGTRATILPGVSIAEGCIVGAGAVVTRSFSRGSIIGGNPARLIGERDPLEFARLESAGAYYLREKQRTGLRKIPRRERLR